MRTVGRRFLASGPKTNGRVQTRNILMRVVNFVVVETRRSALNCWLFSHDNLECCGARVDLITMFIWRLASARAGCLEKCLKFCPSFYVTGFASKFLKLDSKLQVWNFLSTLFSFFYHLPFYYHLPSFSFFLLTVISSFVKSKIINFSFRFRVGNDLRSRKSCTWKMCQAIKKCGFKTNYIQSLTL